MHDDLTPGMPPHHSAASALDRSLRAYRWAAHDKDGWTVGAAVFYGVSYTAVTPSQRARWKRLTFTLRNELPTRHDELSTIREALRELNMYPGNVQYIDTIVDRNQNNGALTEQEWSTLQRLAVALNEFQQQHASALKLFARKD